MILKNVRISNFNSIRDSNEFEIGDITCLVGKNEAGKTAILEALRRLNPVSDQIKDYSVTDDYPRKDVEDYRHNVESGKIEPAVVVHATFELEDADVIALTNRFGNKSIKQKQLTLFKGYSNKHSFEFTLDEEEALKFVIQKYDLISELTEALQKVSSVKSALDILSPAEKTDSVNKLLTELSPMQQIGISSFAYDNVLRERVPQFLYFDEYYQLKGRDNIEILKQRRTNNVLEKSDYPLLGLINLARLDLDTLVNPGRTTELKNRLEGAGNHLTKQIIKYWSQNKHLQMRFDVRPGQPDDPENMKTGTNIWAEVYDNKHWVSTGLETRSRGFVWFFSFLAWYSDLKKNEKPLILLLDEPGLFLHAKAQEDLLKYFDSELKGTHQLIYTTHSPFMVDPKHFNRVRIVQDKSIDSENQLPEDEDGTKVLSEVLEATTDSLFPLQGALGYEIYQTLFVGPNCLIVEGVSDLLFIQGISTILDRKGMEILDARWTITPVGGSDKVPTFVSLIGSQHSLNLAVLIDYQKKDQQSIENLYKEKLLKKKNVYTFSDFTKSAEADIEDMFDVDFYISLVNREYGGSLVNSISRNDLKSGSPRILVNIENYIQKHPLKKNRKFNHYSPARYFVENLASLSDDVSSTTLERFENCFKSINKLLQ